MHLIDHAETMLPAAWAAGPAELYSDTKQSLLSLKSAACNSQHPTADDDAAQGCVCPSARPHLQQLADALSYRQTLG